MNNFQQLPPGLPIPVDDGTALHLCGMRLPDVCLQATDGSRVNLGELDGRVVVFCYPMTGRPDVPLPEGWDQIPGARGCTPQSCSFRDHHHEIQSEGAQVFGLSVQSTDYQKEMSERLHLPFPVLSDSDYAFQKALRLPTFTVHGMTLLKRITFIVDDGVIQFVHYPVFPSDKDPEWVLERLRSARR